MISVIRSCEISAHIVVQTQSQLKAVYKDHAETIIGNCSCVLFLGGKERSMGINYQKLEKDLPRRSGEAAKK